MRKVIDSNQLRSPNLRAYLAQSKRNIAILTDYSAIEAYKGSSLEGIYQSMSILSDFPNQVVILKATNQVCGLNGRGSGLQKRLIDQRQTKEFGEFIHDLRAARGGNPAIQQRLLNHASAANVQMTRILKDMKELGEAFAVTAKLHSKEERGVIRENRAFTPDFIDKTVKSVLGIAAMTFGQHPMVIATPNYGELLNTFIFRNALCTYLLALDWAARGGIQDAKPESLQNDMVDMNFVSYATFFDGLLSNDGKSIRIHEQARRGLKNVFQCRLSGE